MLTNARICFLNAWICVHFQWLSWQEAIMLWNQWSCCIQMEPAGVPSPTFHKGDTTPRRLGWSHVLVPKHLNHVWHSLAGAGRKVKPWKEMGTLKLGGPHPKVCSSWVVLVVGGRTRSYCWKMDTPNLASDWNIIHSKISKVRILTWI